MRKFAIKFVMLLTVSTLALAKSPIPSLPNVQPKPPSVAANAYLLMDSSSKQILAEHNIDAPVEPASLTKMMTVYVVDSEIQAGRLRPDTKVLISKKAWQAPGSRMFVSVNTEVPVSELIKGVIIQSGNDASIALAEHIAGSEEAFAELMNGYAKALGMQNTHFENASGLPHDQHLTTARDMAILARAIIKNFPETYKIYSEKEFFYNGIKQPNRNRLLYKDAKYDGIKTGFTDSAGYCIVGSGTDGSMRLIAVVMGAKSDQARTEEASKLLGWGFRFFESNLVYKAGTKIKDARIWKGSRKRVDVGFAEDLYVTTAKGAYSKCTASMHLVEPLNAPCKQNDMVGTYVIQNQANDVIHEQPVVALRTIKRGNIYQRSRDYLIQKYDSLVSK